MARKVEGTLVTSAIDWSKYMDGNVWELRRGEDFHGSITSFRASFYTAAAARKLVPFSRVVDKEAGVIQIQALPESSKLRKRRRGRTTTKTT